ncbi:hypothetical protein I552_3248 [Mycobacterium xenopi 3993]|nr:hypothetical protein I552_3248 [Mycobacterium xenopi 3993]
MTSTRSRLGPTHDVGVLAMLDDPLLRDELDRAAAAVGVRVVHTSDSAAANRKTWSAAAAVVLDAAASTRCGQQALPRRSHVVVVSGTEPDASTWAAAVAVGAQRVLVLPAQEHQLVGELADAAESVRDQRLRGGVVAVIGGRGGAGASVFAAALAQVAGDALLVDLDPGVVASTYCWAAKMRLDCAGRISRCRAGGSTGRRCARRCRGTAA